MARNTLIKHKEVAVIYEKNELIIVNYNAFITHLESKLVAQPLVTYIITKQPLTYSNCGKIGHAQKTCHNMKRKLAAPIISTRVVQLVVGVTTQLVKPARVALRYPCIFVEL
jgi:hypothetical protein